MDSAAQRIYVTDTLRNKIFVTDMNGSVQKTIGQNGDKPGEFNFPTELRLDGQNLVVVDAMNFRVQVLDRSGQFLYGIGTLGDGNGAMFRPKGIGIDSEGHLYVVEGNHGMVQVFNREGPTALLLRPEGNATSAIFGFPRACLSIAMIGSTWWIPTTTGCRYFIITGCLRPREECSEVPPPACLYDCVSLASAVRAQMSGDVIGMHDLSPGGTSPIQGTRPGSCTYCHVPHSGNGNLAPLWNQKLSTATYTTYTSTTYQQKSNQQMPLGSDSGLCLSCHDGTVGLADTVLFGQMPTSGSWVMGDQFGTQLQSSHPFSLNKPLQDSIDLTSTLVSQGKTADTSGAVQLIMGNVECTSCHNPHVQAVDKVSMNFLVRDGSNGQICLACHDPSAYEHRRIQPGQSLGGMDHQCSQHRREQGIGPVEAGKLWNGQCQCLRLVPRVAQRAGTGAFAARGQRTGLPSLSRRESECFSCAAQHRGGVQQDRASLSERDKFARRRREPGAQQQSSCHLRGLPQPARFATSDVVQRSAA